jgi:hypothetical protein
MRRRRQGRVCAPSTGEARGSNPLSSTSHSRVPLGEDFGWLRLETATVTPGAALAPGADPSEVLWSGQVTVPEIADGLGPRRLVVAEYEEYIVDDDSPYQPPLKRKDRRTVFVEHHVLDL